jgi:hypothetical protein
VRAAPFLGEATIAAAVEQIRRVSEVQSIVDKLQCFITCRAILSTVLHQTGGAAGADDYMPAYCFILMRANPEQLLSNIQFVRTLLQNSLSVKGFVDACVAIKCLMDVSKTVQPKIKLGQRVSRKKRGSRRSSVVSVDGEKPEKSGAAAGATATSDVTATDATSTTPTGSRSASLEGEKKSRGSRSSSSGSGRGSVSAAGGEEKVDDATAARVRAELCQKLTAMNYNLDFINAGLSVLNNAELSEAADGNDANAISKLVEFCTSRQQQSEKER